MLKITSLQVPKDNPDNCPSGKASGYCEDACNPPPNQPPRHVGLLADSIKVAVSDGVSNTSFSGIWADLLVQAYLSGDIGANTAPEQVLTYRKTWWDRVSTMYPNLAGTPLMKARRGSSATLLGLCLTASLGETPGTWRAEACGDSCLAVVRKGTVIVKFPIETSAQFGRRPQSISTGTFKATQPATGHDPPRLAECLGSAEPGDIFFLMTDALAKWFYSNHERCGQPWDDLGRLGEPDEFEQWVVKNRAVKNIDDDDVTLVLAEFY